MKTGEQDKSIELIIEDLARIPVIYKNSMIGLCHNLNIEDQFLGSSLSLARIKALVYLSKKGASPVGEVAQGLGVSIATASQILDRMVDDGWAARETNPADRRQVLVWLLPEATELAAKLRAARRRQVEKALESVPVTEWAAAAAVIRRLTDALEETTGEQFVTSIINALD